MSEYGSDQRWATPPTTWLRPLELCASSLVGSVLLTDSLRFDVLYAVYDTRREWAEWLAKQVGDASVIVGFSKVSRALPYLIVAVNLERGLGKTVGRDE